MGNDFICFTLPLSELQLYANIRKYSQIIRVVANMIIFLYRSCDLPEPHGLGRI